MRDVQYIRNKVKVKSGGGPTAVGLSAVGPQNQMTQFIGPSMENVESDLTWPRAVWSYQPPIWNHRVRRLGSLSADVRTAGDDEAL